MSKFVFVTTVIFISSCAASKHTYYFESYKSPEYSSAAGSNRNNQMRLVTSTDLATASLELVIYEKRAVGIDTGIVSKADLLPRQKQNATSYSQTSKQAKKKAYEDKKKAYLEAKQAYAATKNKRLDGFAIAGPVLFTIAFLCMAYPVAAVWFGILGLASCIIGLKSRIWGLSLASLIAAGVMLTFYIYMSIILGSGE